MKSVLFLLAWLSFSLGIIGAFLPVLPTTPFLILSAYLFSKSSPRFHEWLLNLPVAGEGIRDWNNKKVIKPKAKILCTFMLILSLVSMWTFANVHLAIKALATFIVVFVGVFVLTRNSR